MFKRYLIPLLALFVFSLAGCGDSDSLEDITLDPIGNSGGRVSHVNWNAFNLYSFQNGSWVPVITNGGVTGAFPFIGDRPAIVVHGLGSDILSNRFNNLATSLVQSGATSVFGFEYDSLDSIAKNGGFFQQALTTLTEQRPGSSWRIVGHSMGGLVVRSALENGIPYDVAAGSRVALVATPNLGSPIAVEVTDNPDVIGQALADLILNGRLEFRNIDRTPVEVEGTEPGFQDLRPDSLFLSALNTNAANNHPQFEYRTVAGSERGDDYEALDRALGTFADDGVVDIESANSAFIGALESAIVPFDHSAIVEATEPIITILRFLGF